MAKASLTDRKVRQILNAGSMPNFAEINHNSGSFSSDYARAMDWIHHSVEDEDLKAEIVTYLTNAKRMDDVALVRHFNGVHIKVLGTICYCLNRGAELAAKSFARINTALDEVRNRAVVEGEDSDFEDLADTSSARNIEAYKNCYSRLDNLRALVCKGKVELKDVHDEALKILEANGGLKKAVRKQLVDHYMQSVEEAKEDKAIRDWVKPLQVILKAVVGSTKTDTKVRKTSKTVAIVPPAKTASKPTAKSNETPKKVKATKVVKKGKVQRKAPVRAKREAGVPSVASQVRDLIKAHKKSTDSVGMVEIVVRELGLTKARSKSAVKCFWDKIDA